MSILEIHVWFLLDFGTAHSCSDAGFLHQRWPELSKGGRMATTNCIHICFNCFWDENKHGEEVVLGLAGKEERSCTEGYCFLTISADVQTFETSQLGSKRVLKSRGKSQLWWLWHGQWNAVIVSSFVSSEWWWLVSSRKRSRAVALSFRVSKGICLAF